MQKWGVTVSEQRDKGTDKSGPEESSLSIPCYPGQALITIPGDFQIAPLDPSHLEEIMGLQELVFASLEDKTHCVRLSREEYLDILGEHGIVLGMLYAGRLVALYGALFPGDSSENLGHDLDLPAEKLEQVCHLEISLVHPDYQGKKLQPALGQRVVAAVENLGRHRYLCATVGPNNYVALKNVLALGLCAVQLKQKYQGFWRFILLRDLQMPFKPQQEHPLAVHNNDYEKQIQLLNQGYCGFQQVDISGKPAVLYAKKQ